MKDLKKIVKPGDILLFRATGKTLTLPEKFISWGQHVMNRAPSLRNYYHCALVDEDTEFVIEGKFPKCRRARIDFHAHPNVEVWRMKKATKAQIKLVLADARRHVGEWYDFPLFVFGIFSFKRATVCSTLIRSSWAKAKFIFQNSIQKGKKQILITPDEIASNDELIKRVA